MSFESPQTMQEVPNHLVKAILVTIFCCLPCGVVAIVFAAQVNSQVQTGNIAEAQRLSKQANTWGNVGLIVGILWGIGCFVVWALMIAAGVAANA